LPETYLRGVGLTSMSERAAELGGTFTIERMAEGGHLCAPACRCGVTSKTCNGPNQPSPR
jgi:signal transduction histidine kinase